MEFDFVHPQLLISYANPEKSLTHDWCWQSDSTPPIFMLLYNDGATEPGGHLFAPTPFQKKNSTYNQVQNLTFVCHFMKQNADFHKGISQA